MRRQPQLQLQLRTSPGRFIASPPRSSVRLRSSPSAVVAAGTSRDVISRNILQQWLTEIVHRDSVDYQRGVYQADGGNGRPNMTELHHLACGSTPSIMYRILVLAKRSVLRQHHTRGLDDSRERSAKRSGVQRSARSCGPSWTISRHEDLRCGRRDGCEAVPEALVAHRKGNPAQAGEGSPT